MNTQLPNLLHGSARRAGSFDEFGSQQAKRVSVKERMLQDEDMPWNGLWVDATSLLTNTGSGKIHSQILANLADKMIIDFTMSWDGRSFILSGIVPPGMSTPFPE